ncbi:MAG TPA: FtsX-like permease family protein [Chryseosolibacter sp.]
MWLALAWKNLWRNKNRTAITISAIFFAVILSVSASSLQDGVFDNFIRNMVGYYTGYIQVHQRGYWEHQVLDNCLSQNPTYEANLNSLSNIAAVAPRIESYALASSDETSRGCLVVGISPDEENKITSLQKRIIAGSYFARADSNAVIVSEGLLKRLDLRISDTLYLISQGYHGSMAAGKYPIKGIMKFGAPELNDQLVFMPLKTAQEFYSAPGLLTSYVLGLKTDSKLSSTVGAVTELSAGMEYEVMSWKELLPDVDQHITMDKASMFIILIILYLLICFGIFGTLLMMTVERKYEMGMLVAIGMKKWKLAMLFIIESLLSVLLGCLAGLVASIPIVYYLKEHPIRIGGELAESFKRFNFEPVFPASMELATFLTHGAIVFCIGLILSVYPVIVALRINPVRAMKK